MAKYAILQSFYASEEWQNFRMVVILDNAKKYNGFKCEYCNQEVKDVRDITAHHKVELTPENVHDRMISLNPELIMVVHHECHNKIHGRFGYKIEKGVYIVYGPPLSGKHTYVSQYVTRGDIIVDMDRLYSAVSGLPYFDKPDNLLANVRGIHNLLIDNIKTRYGKWNSAWIIGGYADRFRRERLAEDLGAELIFCDVSKEVCLQRLEQDVDRRHRKDEWRRYIEEWFEKYSA